MKIEQKELDKVLEGIGNGFGWRRSKQRYNYWAGVKDNLHRLGAKQTFNYVYVPTPNISLCKQARDNLLTAFVWDESPQGEKYWVKVHNYLEEIITSNSEKTINLEKAYDDAMSII